MYCHLVLSEHQPECRYGTLPDFVVFGRNTTDSSIANVAFNRTYHHLYHLYHFYHL